MADEIAEHAPAKVNLTLHVTGQRADGYHLLETLVVFTRTGDRVSVRSAASDSLSLTGPFSGALGEGSDNLVLRARNLLRDSFPQTPAVAITLEKNLPVASGLGGGSSDAAAALRALQRLWKLDIPPDFLAEAALALGADLPMCLAARPLLVRGIGEQLEEVNGLPSLAMVLVNPGVAVSTPAIFRALHSRQNPSLPPLPRQPGFAALVSWLETTRNDLQVPAALTVPAISEVLAALEHSGAALSRMSGSGATCFGLYESDAHAAVAAARIAAAQPSWYVEATTTERNIADAAP